MRDTDNSPIPIKVISGLVRKKTITLPGGEESLVSAPTASSHGFTDQGGAVLAPATARGKVRLMAGAKRVEVPFSRLSRDRQALVSRLINVSKRARAYLNESGLQILFSFRGDVTATPRSFSEDFNDRETVTRETLFINIQVSGLFGGAATLVFGSIYSQDFNSLPDGEVTLPGNTGGAGFLSNVSHLPFVIQFTHTLNSGDGSAPDTLLGITAEDIVITDLDFSV